MAFSRTWWLVLLVLALGAGSGRAAGGREQRAYDEAVLAFHNGLWDLADLEFAQFAQKYPASPRLPAAGLFQAQAEFKLGKYAQCELLLTTRRAAAGTNADAYAYWIGEAQFQKGDFAAAAGTLESVPRGSEYALRAAVDAAAALAKMRQWPVLITFLEGEQEVFQRVEQNDPDNELGLRGKLWLARAHFEQKDFAAAGRLLAAIKPAVLPPDLEWLRLYLLCRVKQAAGEWEAVLPLAANLLQIARSSPVGATNLSLSVALHATVLEQLGQTNEARAAFRENLAANVPAESQRQAVLNIAQLSPGPRELTNAETMLEDYVARFPNAPALDAALLGLGELYLHDYLAQPAQTNLLVTAQTRFDQLLAAGTNNPFAGKAYLDRGWCDWLAGDSAASLADFRKATERLPLSEDLAVARFQYGDALFAREDYAEALIQYQAVLGHFADFPGVGPSLGDRALYQSLRAQIQLGDWAGAATNMARMAADYPAGELRPAGPLPPGAGYPDLRQPTNALALFQKFEAAQPGSPLRPAVDLAMARAYEQETNWPAAIAQYDGWVRAYPTNPLLPQALFSRARANDQAGDETNALIQFTNFVAQFPLHELAPLAQWWVADHYFRLDDTINAERNYKAIFQNTNWQGSDLFYPALMMAGRAAVARTDYDEAIRDYFEKMEADTNCPLPLRVSATFAHGAALMKSESPDTNNPTANFLLAAKVFNTICASSFPTDSTNDWGARAWGELGDCYLQLSRYEDATNAYQKALTSPQASLSVRSEAQIGLGQVLEKEAGLLPAGPEQTALYTAALANYCEVFYRPAEDRELDPFWTKKAGLCAANLVSALGQWRPATLLYSNLVTLMPELKASLARKMEEASQHLNSPNQ